MVTRKRATKFLLLLSLCFATGAAFGPRWRLLRAALHYRADAVALTMPVEGLAREKVVSTWHARRGQSRRHEGVDLFAPRGTPVRSATRGVVWRVGEDALGGRVVSVVGEGRALYYYAHLDTWAAGLRPGDEVQPGALLGTVGNTGNARTTPPHLHFGVYRVGLAGARPTDPAPLLQKAPVPPRPR